MMTGDSETSLNLLKKLEIPYSKNRNISSFASVELTDNKLTLKNLNVQPGLIPDVTGMGIGDALPLLENQGLKVNVTGYGKIIKQSRIPGEQIIPGQTIELILEYS